MTQFNESAEKYDADQQGVPFPFTGIKDFDDWDLISDTTSGTRIKKVTIFADYYICAFEIVYVDKHGKETHSVHSLDESYLKQPHNMKRCELEVDEDDYIEYISCAYSSQRTFIRSIRIATHKKKLLVHEGEVELKNQEPQQLINSRTSDSNEGSKLRMSKNVSKSAICNSKHKNSQQKMAMMVEENTRSQKPDTASDDESEKLENVSESSFSLKRPSLVDFYLKTQSWNLGKLNLKVVGFKTYFNGYLEDIEVYAEPLELEDDENGKTRADDNSSDINN